MQTVVAAEGNMSGVVSGFRIRTVLATSCRFYYHNFIRFFLVVLAAGLPVFITAAVLTILRGSTGPTNTQFENGGQEVVQLWAWIGQSAVSISWWTTAFLVYPLAASLIIYIVVEGLRDQQKNVGISDWRATGHALKPIGSNILLIVVEYSILLFIALVFGIVWQLARFETIAINTVEGHLLKVLMYLPTLIPEAIWAVAIPSSVIEGNGPLASLGRSRRLTKGYRLLTGAISFVLLVMGELIDFIIERFFGVIDVDAVPYLAVIIITARIPLAMFAYTISGVMYHYLALSQEKLAVRELAGVFD